MARADHETRSDWETGKDNLFIAAGDVRYLPPDPSDPTPGRGSRWRYNPAYHEQEPAYPPAPPPSGGQQSPPSDADGLLDQLAREFGLDPSQLGGATQADPYAIFAQGVSPSDPVGTRAAMSQPGHPVSERSRPVYRGEISTEPVGEVLKLFYQLEPSVLRRMQALLFAGGFYGNAEVGDVAWGQHDEASFAAWSQAVARTARRNAAGEKVTYHQVIGDAAWAAGLDPESLGRALEEGDDSIEALLGRLTGDEKGRTIDVILSDPNGLRSTMDNVASVVLGRKSNAAEQRMFISMIHNLQRQGQITMQTAEAGDTVPVGADPVSALGLDDTMLQAGDVVTEYAPPSEEATAEALLRQQNPAEAGAHDIATQFAALLEMLPAPVNVPRVTI